MSLVYLMQGCLAVYQAQLAQATGRRPWVTSSLLLALVEQVTPPAHAPASAAGSRTRQLSATYPDSVWTSKWAQRRPEGETSPLLSLLGKSMVGTAGGTAGLGVTACGRAARGGCSGTGEVSELGNAAVKKIPVQLQWLRYCQESGRSSAPANSPALQIHNLTRPES